MDGKDAELSQLEIKDHLRHFIRSIERSEKRLEKANEKLKKALEDSENILDIKLPAKDHREVWEDLIPYRLDGSTIKTHAELDDKKAQYLIEKTGDQHNQQVWSSDKQATDKLAGWIHIKFKKPLVMNGFAVTAGFNMDKNPKDFRFYAKVIRHKGELATINEDEFGPVAGFDLLKTVNKAVFHHRRFQNRYEFDNQAKHLVVSEIKLMIDTCQGGEKESPELYKITPLY